MRESAGLFDIDHMGQFRVEGPDALPYLQHVLTANVSTLEVNHAQYGLLCYGDGGTVDDTFVYRFVDHWMVVVNAGNKDKDLAWMNSQRNEYTVQVTDVSDKYYMLALQGPKAEQVLQRLEGFDLKELNYHTARWFKIHGESGIIARTGYTGEDGFELFVPMPDGKHIWDAILSTGKEDGVLPIGLGARDSLRFEAKFALYDHELTAEISPIEAALSWACDLNKEFVGREALLKQKLEGVKRKLVGFEMIDRGIARKDYEITKDGKSIGIVTSGMFAPTLQKNLGLGYVQPEFAKQNTEFEVMVRGKPLKARTVKTPFYANRARGK